MSDFLDKLATQIFTSEGYEDATSSLFESYVLSLTGVNKKLDRAEVKKLISSAQIFYKSNDERLKNEGAILLSMIMGLCADDYPDIVPIANNMYAGSGDFPNIALLNKLHPDLKFRYNFYSEAQIEFRQSLNTVEALDFPLTDYQRSLWADLTSDQDVITSAPTSAGKTYIILNYLLDKVSRGEGSFAVIIVPTRALISEVAATIYELAKERDHTNEIEICTVPKDNDEEYGDKTFFVMTQERLYEVLMRGDITFNYLFIDEAHNIADKSRGVLLHLSIEKMLEDSVPQIIISMPSSSYQNSFSTIFKDVEFTKEITRSSPVAKVMMSVVPKGRQLIISRQNSTDEKSIQKGFTDTKFADIVYKLGNGQSNIIFRNQTDHCEYFANQITSLITEVEKNPLLEEAADYVEQFVHKNFSLAANLRKGVAFHYGPLPSSIRVMVENLVKDDQIKFIACTSTLAEGVNLPAKNLFLKNPTQSVFLKPSERIEDVKINNITGRAGRMLQHFAGNIFLIEPKKWTFQDYFDEKPEEEEKIPTYFKTLNEELKLVIDALQGKHPHEEGDQYRLYTIANKLIKEFAGNNLDNTLQAEELILSTDERDLLYQSVRTAHNDLKVTAFTLEANPTVGYIQQNKLFSFLDEQKQFEDWVLPHPRASNLYETLLRVCKQLYDAGVYIPTENYTLKHICTITRKWIQGKSLKDMISEQIEWEIQNNKTAIQVNTSVRNVIKIINNDIRFRLSNALRCYHVLLSGILVSKGIELPNVKLHSFIEIGACDDRMISLINTGLSREAAKEIHDTLPNRENIDSSKDVLRLLNAENLDDIHAITKKEIFQLFNE